jgi:general secretion pathway protein G
VKPQSENGSECRKAQRASSSRALTRFRLLKLVATTLTVGCGIAWTVAHAGVYELVLYRTPQDQVRNLVLALECFHLDYGRYPTREEGLGILTIETSPKSPGQGHWGGPYIDDRSLKDPWGHPYEYRCLGRNGRPFELFSPGEDDLYGTDDDVHSWELEKLDKIYRSSGVRSESQAGQISDTFALGFWLGSGTLVVLWVLALSRKHKCGMTEG